MKQYLAGRYKPFSYTLLLRITLRLLAVSLLITALYQLYKDFPQCSDADEDPENTRHRVHKRTGRRLDNNIIRPSSWRVPDVPEYINRLEQDDPELIEYIRKYWLIKPIPGSLVLSNPDRVDRSQAGQALCVDHLSGAKQHGFFVEAGASNGETFSNTLYLERFRNWTGLLVEPNPEYFAEMLTKRRHVYMVNACLSPSIKPIRVNFSLSKLMGALEDYLTESHLEVIQKPKRYSRSIKVQCFPTYSILKALNVNKVDYFSLDVEGTETLVLDTLPLEKIDINIFSVDYRIAKDKAESQFKLQQIIKLLENYGYHFAGKMMRLDVILQKGKKRQQDPVCFPQRTKTF